MSENTALNSKKPDEQTFQHQDRLPSLPVPPLEQTCRKYLESVRHLVNDEQYITTEFIVDEFRCGIGKQLHKKLENKAKISRNWLEKWWENVGYLMPRSPVAPYINIGGLISLNNDVWPPKEGTQLKRAAIFTHCLLQVWKLFYRQKRRVDKMGSIPLCMYQYKRLFSCCRVPGKDIDYIESSFQTAPGRNPRHMVILYKGRIFSAEVLDDHYEPLTPPEIESQLQEIVRDADAKGEGPAVCSLTGEERHVWFELRERLLSLDKVHSDYLEKIQSSLFILTLEVTEPVTDTEISMQSTAGDCRYRWFDKSLNCLVFKNGVLATHCDHVHFDGIVEIDSIIDACRILRDSNGEWKESPIIRSQLPEPVEFEFHLDDHLLRGIDQAILKYTAKASDLDVVDWRFEEYGKGFSKSVKIHPDTYMQMVIQLTYYRLHGKPVATYETAQTRQFFHGRTETVRSCTAESVSWTKAMMDPEVEVLTPGRGKPKVSNISSITFTAMATQERTLDISQHISPSTKEQLLRQAIDKHNKLMKEAVYGNGIDRHLFGLQLQAAEDALPVPKIFVDKSWTVSGGGANFGLSTSCVGFNEVHGSCAPMIADGYGVFYSIEEHCFHTSISTWKSSPNTDGNKFKEALIESFRDVRRLLSRNAKL